MKTGQKENLDRTDTTTQPAEAFHDRLEKLISHLPNAVYSSCPDASGTTTFISKRWEDWTGYTEEDFHRDPKLWQQSIHPDDRQEAIEDYLKACHDKTSYCHQYRILHKDTGQLRWVKDQGTPCLDRDGNFVCFEGMVTDITQEKDYEEQLRSARDAWVGIFESISDSVLVLDLDSKVIDANHASLDFLQMTKEELIGRHCYELFHNTDGPPENCPHIKLLKTGKPCCEEMDVQSFGRIFAVSVSPVYDEHGKIVKTIHIAKDITEQRQSKQALEESEARFRMSFNQGYQFAVLMDINGIVIEANELCHKATALTREEVVGKHFRDLPWWPEGPKEPEAIDEDIALALAGHIAEREVTYIDRFGNRRQAERTIGAIYDSDQQPIFLLGQALDITERKRYEEKIERLAKFPSENPNPVMRIRSDGELIYHNTASDCILKWWNISPENRVPGQKLSIVKKALHSNQCENHEFDCKDGTYMLNFVPIAEMGYVNIYGFNITALKKAEKNQEQLLKALSHKNEELESIIYISSHDLRSPLVNISGYSSELETLAREIESEVNRRKTSGSSTERLTDIIQHDIPECLKYISAGTNKMDTLLDGLLRLCRIGRTELKFCCVDANMLLKTVLDSMQYQINEIHAHIEINPLPACIADPEQLSQIFSNLIDNAIKYRDPNRSLTIQIDGIPANHTVTYRIGDNGLGIQPEYHLKIFEIFHQLHPQSGIRGEGLGLTIAKRAINRMNGSIDVESEFGHGSTFILTLPAAL